MFGPVTMQLEQLRERFGGADVRQVTTDVMLVTVPNVRLPEGWSKPSIGLRATRAWSMIQNSDPPTISVWRLGR